MIFIILSIISLIGLLSYYIIFSRIKISSFDIKNSSFTEPISIIICAKNELKNIKRFFPSWINQKYKEFELIIVNDNSSDGSYEYLTNLEKKHEKLKIIHTNVLAEKDEILKLLKGKRYALRKGIIASQNDYIILTDADCKPVSEYWISEMMKAFSNSKTEIVLGYSPYFKEKSLVNIFIQLETLTTAILYFGFANLGLPYMGVGRNIAYKKSIFYDDVFINSNKSISGDDDLIVQQLANRYNTEYIISKKSIVKSIPKSSFYSWFKQKKRHLGAGFHYSFFLKIVLNLFPFLHLLFYLSLIGLFYYNYIVLAFIFLAIHVYIFYIVVKGFLNKCKI